MHTELDRGFHERPSESAREKVLASTSCHTELDSLYDHCVSARFYLVGGTGIEPVAPAVSREAGGPPQKASPERSGLLRRRTQQMRSVTALTILSPFRPTCTEN